MIRIVIFKVMILGYILQTGKGKAKKKKEPHIPARAYALSLRFILAIPERSFLMWNLAFRYAARVAPPARAAAAVPVCGMLVICSSDLQLNHDQIHAPYVVYVRV